MHVHCVHVHAVLCKVVCMRAHVQAANVCLYL